MTATKRRTLVLAAVCLGGVGIAASMFGLLPAVGVEKPRAQFQTLHHGAMNLDSLHGKPVLVTFWATTCTICLSEMPELVKLYQRHRARGFELVAVAMPYDAAWLVADYATSRALPFPVAFDAKGEAVKAFGSIDGTPTAFLLDKQGRVVERIRGRPDFGRLNAKIEDLLLES